MGTCVRDGWVLPLVDESTWPVPLRVFLYFVGLLWFLVAEAVTVTAPLTAIEVLTSLTKTKRVRDLERPGHVKETRVRRWNLAVANLTLIAFGTCTPKILLATMEIIGSEFYTGELGVATIVGSSAFSLLFVTGLCIMATPAGQSRYLKKAKPYFSLVVAFAFFAYLWIFLILEVITPKTVELWEAFFTLTLYPILVILVYITDVWSRRQKVTGVEKPKPAGQDSVRTDSEHINASSVTKMLKGIGESRQRKLTTEEAAALATVEASRDIPRSAVWFRVGAMRTASGAQRLLPSVEQTTSQKNVYELSGSRDRDCGDDAVSAKSVVEFSSTSYSVLESNDRVSLRIVRTGKLHKQVLFRYETIDGTAVSDADYVERKGILVLQPGERDIRLDIDIRDDSQWEEEKAFYVRLSLIDTRDPNLELGKKNVAEVTIIDDDDPGMLEFHQAAYVFKENAGVAKLKVVRKNGAAGRISVTWRTVDKTAVHGRDYEASNGKLEFEDGEREKSVTIKIYNDQSYEKDEVFVVKLVRAHGGARIGGISKASVTILNDDEFKNLVDEVVVLTKLKIDRLQLGNSSWGQQIKEAMLVNGGAKEKATTLDYVLHIVSFFWKVLTACVPPPSFLNSRGVITLLVGLALEGFIVAIMVDMANTFGCLIGLNDSVIAVTFTSTFVSLGTSLPELMATRMSVKSDKYADTSVGVVIGNSAVMVYLGLGLPWVIASIYWTVKGQYFEIPTKTLAFNIPVYCVFAVLSIVVLIMRRSFAACGKAELGGPTVPKVISGIFFVLMWLLFIVLSSLYAHEVLSF